MSIRLTRAEVVEKSKLLPAFPSIVTQVLETIDDDNSTLGELVVHIEHDPVITARVVSLANGISMQRRHQVKMGDVYTATSMIGMERLREVVVGLSMAEFARTAKLATRFWEHSVSVGVCAQELAKSVGLSTDYAFVAGLLHDMGQLWLSRFYPAEFAQACQLAEMGKMPIVEAERQKLGLDHCQIGGCIGELWGLPPLVQDAIQFHHHPLPEMDTLVAVTHVAEVIANALNLGAGTGSQVTYLSAAACEKLHIDFTEDMQHLFGRMEARADFACAIFRK
jgi:putative nucleotidyltransferase with HDIG domain